MRNRISPKKVFGRNFSSIDEDFLNKHNKCGEGLEKEFLAYK